MRRRSTSSSPVDNDTSPYETFEDAKEELKDPATTGVFPVLGAALLFNGDCLLYGPLDEPLFCVVVVLWLVVLVLGLELVLTGEWVEDIDCCCWWWWWWWSGVDGALTVAGEGEIVCRWWWGWWWCVGVVCGWWWWVGVGLNPTLDGGRLSSWLTGLLTPSSETIQKYFRNLQQEIEQ